MQEDVRAELERRLALIENDPAEGVLAPLPRIDLMLTVAVLAIMTVLLLWWSL